MTERDLKVGDFVWTTYFGVVHKAKVLKVGRTRVRVGFYNCSGYWIEAWRRINRIAKAD